MNILISIGSAAGILNHGLALSFLLSKRGHRVIWLTGVDSKPHLSLMKSPFSSIFSDAHNIDFRRNTPGRLPHLQQLCETDRVVRCSNVEAEVMRDYDIDLVINKHYYSMILTASRLKVPLATYYTDGPLYLLRDRNPQARVTNEGAHKSLNRAANRFGQPELIVGPPFCLTSSVLNIVRGTKRTTALTEHEFIGLPQATFFCGALTYDGPPDNFAQIEFPANKSIVYLTFGTIAQDATTIKRVLSALEKMTNVEVIVSIFAIGEELPVYSNAQMVRYIPNAVAFEKASLVIHHGGHGTMLGAMSAGIPQIIIPDNSVSTAQDHHGVAVELLGVGKKLSPKATCAEVTNAVLACFLPALQERARSEGRLLREDTARLEQLLLLRLDNLADQASLIS